MNVKNIILNAEKWLSIQEYTKRHWLQLRIQISQIIYWSKIFDYSLFYGSIIY